MIYTTLPFCSLMSLLFALIRTWWRALLHIYYILYCASTTARRIRLILSSTFFNFFLITVYSAEVIAKCLVATSRYLQPDSAKNNSPAVSAQQPILLYVLHYYL